MAGIITEHVHIGSELNVIRLEIQQGGVAVDETFFDVITRIIIRFGNAVVDSDDVAVPAGTFDWVTEKSSSILRLVLGQAVVVGDFTTVPAFYGVSLNIYQGTDNAVISNVNDKTLRFRVFDDPDA